MFSRVIAEISIYQMKFIFLVHIIDAKLTEFFLFATFRLDPSFVEK